MLKREKIRVRKDLTRDKGHLDGEAPVPAKRSPTVRKVILRTLSEDVLMKSQETEPDCNMISLASSRFDLSTAVDKFCRLRSGSDIMEIEEYTSSSVDSWVSACRSEADAAMVFAELEEKRARTAAALACEALIRANKLAAAAEEAKKKAAVACKEAKAAKVSAKEAADFAVKSLEAATKAEESAARFISLQN